MSENTLQFQWIVTLQGGLDDLFRDRPDVFVAGDLLWYPVEGSPEIRTAPDALVAFGRPKGYRGSYMQWEEGGIAPQVVFEVLSPGNRPGAMDDKFRFYQDHGVQEYYLYDPYQIRLDGWRRVGSAVQKIDQTDGWTSPLLGIRFDLCGDDLQVFRPDGRRFATYLELAAQREAEQVARAKAQFRAEQAQRRAEFERRRADRERQQADQERKRAEQERQRADRLAARLRELGEEPPV
jgi:Uma2 family endonuclease